MPDPAEPSEPEPSAPHSSADEDRRLAELLSRRGVPQDEVQRLLALGHREELAGAPAPTVTGAAAFTVDTPEEIELHPSIALPDLRECSSEEQAAAERLLAQAHLARRREKWGEAERLCVEALSQCPADPGGLELLGDICQAVGRVDDALTAYQRAVEVQPGRKSAERRYAALRLQQNRELEALRTEYIPRSPLVAVLLTALFPGAGQVYNGAAAKGLVVALAMLVCLLLLFWSPWGVGGAGAGLTSGTVAFGLLAGAVYIYAICDANVGARGGPRSNGKSGWEV